MDTIAGEVNNVLDRVTHLSEPSAGAGEMSSLARRAIAAATTTLPLVQLWEMLASGGARVVRSFCDDSRCFLVLKDNESKEPRSPRESRNVAILKRILLGEPQKRIAIELELSASCVTGAASGGADAMGLRCTASRVPVLVVMAAQAHAHGYGRTVARSAVFGHNQQLYRAVSVERPDPGSLPVLSPAEHAVVDLLLERHSNAEIARVRRTSLLTVANQIASILRKLDAGGRPQILARFCATWLTVNHRKNAPVPELLLAGNGH